MQQFGNRIRVESATTAYKNGDPHWNLVRQVPKSGLPEQTLPRSTSQVESGDRIALRRLQERQADRPALRAGAQRQAIATTNLLLKTIWITGLVALPLLTWMGYFLLIYPKAMAQMLRRSLRPPRK